MLSKFEKKEMQVLIIYALSSRSFFFSETFIQGCSKWQSMQLPVSMRTCDLWRHGFYQSVSIRYFRSSFGFLLKYIRGTNPVNWTSNQIKYKYVNILFKIPILDLIQEMIMDQFGFTHRAWLVFFLQIGIFFTQNSCDCCKCTNNDMIR